MSYNGAIDFGLLGDYDALPDIDTIADGIEDGLAQLKSGRESEGGARRRRARRRRRRGAPRPPARPPRRRRPATRAGETGARARGDGRARAADGPQLLPSGPPRAPTGPARRCASARASARRRATAASAG